MQQNQTTEHRNVLMCAYDDVMQIRKELRGLDIIIGAAYGAVWCDKGIVIEHRVLNTLESDLFYLCGFEQSRDDSYAASLTALEARRTLTPDFRPRLLNVHQKLAEESPAIADGVMSKYGKFPPLTMKEHEELGRRLLHSAYALEKLIPKLEKLEKVYTGDRYTCKRLVVNTKRLLKLINNLCRSLEQTPDGATYYDH